MKTSIVVPCVPGHIRYLREALVPYIQKGFTPEDVVVSIAKKEEISEEQHQTLMDTVSTLDLNIKVILNSGLVRSGPNRQLATDQASGDLIV